MKIIMTDPYQPVFRLQRIIKIIIIIVIVIAMIITLYYLVPATTTKNTSIIIFITKNWFITTNINGMITKCIMAMIMNDDISF